MWPLPEHNEWWSLRQLPCPICWGPAVRVLCRLHRTHFAVVADSLTGQPGRCDDLHFLSVYQNNFGEILGSVFLELQRQSTKPWNLMGWFSGCQSVELGVMANGAASALSIHWGFLSTKTSETELNASLYNTWAVSSHADDAMALSVLVTHSQRWQAELPVSTALWLLGELSELVSVLDGGDSSMAANSVCFEGDLTCIWTVEPESAGLLLDGIEIVAGCVNVVGKWHYVLPHCHVLSETAALGCRDRIRADVGAALMSVGI